ncbi:MAG: YfiR family protein [Luminiphilus sp.]|nr:YfiR family protein [Luminiphilus sp.]
MASKPVGVRALMSALLCFFSVLPSESTQSAPGLTEVELKAVFLLRLPQFVSWSDERQPTTFCATERSEVTDLLAEMVVLEPWGRTLKIIDAEASEECDVVYGSAASVLRVSARRALLVSDEPGYARNGGMVELKRRGARIDLVVNVGALESAGLRASSKLLQLSEVVGVRPDD